MPLSSCNTCILCNISKAKPANSIRFSDIINRKMYKANCTCHYFVHEKCFNTWCNYRYYFYPPECMICKKIWVEDL